MTTNEGPARVPDACTLPTAERPLRLAEFDDLFTTAVRRVEALTPTRSRLHLAGPAGLATTVRDLTAREAECCTFFAFTISPAPAPAADGEALTLDIEVPTERTAVLASLTTRAAADSA